MAVALSWRNLGCSDVLAVAMGSVVYGLSSGWGEGKQLCAVPSEDNYVACVSWQPAEGTILATGNAQGFDVWDISVGSRTVSKKLASEKRVSAISWNRSSPEVFAYGSKDTHLSIFDMRAESEAFAIQKHSQEVCGLSWSADGLLIASGGNDSSVHVWDCRKLSTSTTPLCSMCDSTAAVKALSWNPFFGSSRYLLTGGGTTDKRIRLWDLHTPGVEVACLDTGAQVCNVLWSASSPHEFVSTHGYSLNHVVVWSVEEAAGAGLQPFAGAREAFLRRLGTLTEHTQRVLYLAASPDGETVVTGSRDESLRFWRVFERGSRAAGPGGSVGG